LAKDKAKALKGKKCIFGKFIYEIKEIRRKVR